MQTFRLIPYPARKLPKIQLNGEVGRAENHLFIRYAVHGDVKDILLPTSAYRSRQHDLWKSTCFEFFLAVKGQPPYWEFNLSPSGAWNVYRMDAYRQVNMREEAAFEEIPFEFLKTTQEASLDIVVDLSPILSPNQTIQAGITAVIQTRDETETYWALAHPGSQADFHLRESFTLEL